MTVQDLIDKLMLLQDKSLTVHLEGCDCGSDWDGRLSTYANCPGRLELRREDGVDEGAPNMRDAFTGEPYSRG